MTRSRSGVANLTGPALLGLVALIYNTVARRRGQPTISTGVRWVAGRSNGDVVVGAVCGALLFHWFVNGNAL